jgi:hypothetical protein
MLCSKAPNSSWHHRIVSRLIKWGWLNTNVQDMWIGRNAARVGTIYMHNSIGTDTGKCEPQFRYSHSNVPRSTTISLNILFNCTLQIFH